MQAAVICIYNLLEGSFEKDVNAAECQSLRAVTGKSCLIGGNGLLSDVYIMLK